MGHWVDQGHYETYTPLGWDGGARTLAELEVDGGFTFSVGQAVGIVCGLNSDNNGAEYYEIQHGFYIETGKARVIELGEYQSAFFNYTINTSVFEIVRIEGTVKYYCDSQLIYTSNQPSTGIVFLDASLYAGSDTIIDAAVYDYSSVPNLSISVALEIEEAPDLFITLPPPDIIFEEALTDFDGVLRIRTKKPTLIIEEAPSLVITLDSLSLTIDEAPDLSILIHSVDVVLWMEETSTVQITLPKPTLALRETVIVPDFALFQKTINKPTVYLEEEEYLELVIDVPRIKTFISEFESFLFIELQTQLQINAGINNFFLLSVPDFRLSLSDNRDYIIGLNTTPCGGTSGFFLHRTSYQGSDRQEAILLHETSVSGMEGQLLHATTYQSGSRTHAQAVNEAIYGTFGLAPTLATHSVLWSSASLAPSFSTHQASWASTGAASSTFTLHDALWSSRILSPSFTLHKSDWASLGGVEQRIALHDSFWSSRILTSTETLHTSEWASIGRSVIPILHTVEWSTAGGLSAQFTLHTSEWGSSGSVTQQLAVHEVLWSSRILTPSFTLHESTFASIGTANVFAAHTSEWQSVGGLSQVFGLHESLWSSRILTSTHTLHSSTWASIGREFIISLNDVSWSSVGSLSTQFTVHTSEWSTAGGSTQQIALHDALWSSRILTPSQSLHESTWTSSGLQVTLASHQSTWASSGTSSFVFSQHQTSWSVRPTMLQAHEQRWKSIVETSMLHHSAYETVDNAFALQIHRLLWRSNQTAPIINTGLIYARI